MRRRSEIRKRQSSGASTWPVDEAEELNVDRNESRSVVIVVGDRAGDRSGDGSGRTT